MKTTGKIIRIGTVFFFYLCVVVLKIWVFFAILTFLLVLNLRIQVPKSCYSKRNGLGLNIQCGGGVFSGAFLVQALFSNSNNVDF